MTRKTLSAHIEEFERKQAGLTTNAIKCCMHKVHEQLRNVNRKAYKPVLLAIGPDNDQDKVGQGFMQEHKLRYLQQMLKRTRISVKTYIEALKASEEALNYYPDEFVEMMLLDGCFIIELFHRYNELCEKPRVLKDDPIFQMKWVRSRIARDLLLFENQLPFFVLKKLFEVSEGNKTAEIIQTRLNNLALKFFSDLLPFEWNVDASSYNSTKKIEDLLDLTPSLPLLGKRLTVGFRFKNAKFEHLLDLVHTTICLSLLDTELVHARERQEADAKLKIGGILKPLFCKMAICYGGEFQNPESKATMAETEDVEPIPVGAAETGDSVSMEKLHKRTGAAETGDSVSMEKLDKKRRAAETRVEIFTMACEDVEEISYGGEFQNPVSKDTMAETEDVKSIKSGAAETGDFVSMRKLHRRKGAAGTGDSVSIQVEPKFQEAAGVELLDKAKKFIDEYEIINNHWTKIPFAFELQEAGIELEKAKEFERLLAHPNRKEDQKTKPCETVEKFKRLLCLDKIERWKSIPYGKELQKAGVEFKKAKKFKRLRGLEENNERWNIHGATELKEAGIKFKKAEKCFSIKFNKGLMEISPLTIDDHTETYLRNLIAYEQYCDRDNGNYFTNYVRFMDDLINSPKDVELLRREGIIRNYLGDDVVISRMVTKLCDNINFSTTNSIYARTSMDVNRYCKRKWNVSMATLRRDYFNSPWAWISFLAAVFLLGLTIVQTVFSIIP